MITKEISAKESERVIFDDEMWSRIGGEKEKPDLPTKDVKYIGGYVDGEIIGVIVYYTRELYTTVHIHVLKKYRPRHAVRFAKDVLKKYECGELYTNIPPRFKKVIRFAEYLGFRCIVETNKQMIFKRG